MQTKSFIRIVCLLYTVNKDAYIDIKITALKHLSHFDISLEWNSFRAWRVVKHTTIQRLVWWMMDDLHRYVRRYRGIGVQGTMPPTVVVPPWQFFPNYEKWHGTMCTWTDAMLCVMWIKSFCGSPWAHSWQKKRGKERKWNVRIREQKKDYKVPPWSYGAPYVLTTWRRACLHHVSGSKLPQLVWCCFMIARC